MRWAGLALLLTALPAGNALAQSCSVTVQGDLAFGTYDPFAATPLDAQTRIRIRCPASLWPRVLISKGYSATYVDRELRCGLEPLRYNLFTSAARTTVWGDGTEGSVYVDPGRGNANLNVFGRIRPGQDPIVGAYGDSITVTVLF